MRRWRWGVAAVLVIAAAVRGEPGAALDRLEKQASGPEVNDAVGEVVGALRRGGKAAEALGVRIDGLSEKIPEAKLGIRLTGLTRVAVARRWLAGLDGPAEQVKAHPWAASFPGNVPAEARRVSRTIAADKQRPGWQSTGLYAAPGEVVTVRIPEEAAGKGWGVRIGSHTDGLWKAESWRRFPEISRHWALRTPEVRLASAFGGLIYITGPAAGEGTVSVEISGAVEAPRFVLGVMEAKAWRDTLRAAPGPWAELESADVVLTVPSKQIRTLEDPAALLAFWNQVLDADADLAGRPRQRARAERYVADVQISAGYMHSGYPIMTHLDAAPRMVSLEGLRTKGDWGLFHEMGHNHQDGAWTFAGTGEVTCNLFTLYVLETVCDHVPRRKGLSAAENLAKMKAHAAAGADFAAWQKDPFLALSMYVQVRDGFGWEPLKQAIAGYRTLPAAERPRSDAAKRDLWLVRISKATGRNLGPFFDAWGVPVSAAAKAQVKNLPAWMPQGWEAPVTGAATAPGGH